MVEFVLWVEETGKVTDTIGIYDSMLGVSQEFVYEFDDLMARRDLDGGNVMTSGLWVKYIKGDFTRKVWVEIGEPKEF